MKTKNKAISLADIEAAGFDSDQAQRVRALCAHLECAPDDLTATHGENNFALNRRKVKRGTSPDEARAAVRFIADTLARCPEPVLVKRCPLVDSLLVPDCRIVPGDTHRPIKLHADGKPLALAVLRCFDYGDISREISKHAPDALKVGLHAVLNGLYFLSRETDGDKEHARDHRDTLREAWQVMAGEATEIKDRRTDEETNSGEYMVLTDDEADRAWDESLDSYLDECVLGELPEMARNYFDREKWKDDAKLDGRGHSLSGYDSEENEATAIDPESDEEEKFYIYRTN